jgi:Cdc6-like AAA superfamily ATPase
LPWAAGYMKSGVLTHPLSLLKGWAVVVIDEFDKIIDKQTKAYFADLIKTLSDSRATVTLIIVGVGDNIVDLVGEHPSISRNLVQIELPKMSDDEIKEIIKTGFAGLKYTVSADLSDSIALLAHGFPHYAHLLGLNCIKACLKNNTTNLSEGV